MRRIIDDGGAASALVADVADPAGVDGDGRRRRSTRSAVSTASSTTSASVPRPGLDRSTPEAWDAVLAVNLRGAMLTARAALPVLADGASIVFISSVAGIKPGSRIPAYDASKAALGGLMRHVALEGAAPRRSGPTSSRLA